MLLIERYKQIYNAEAGHAFPEDAHEQLMRAVRAVFDSWNSPRARVYRQRTRFLKTSAPPST